MKSNIEKWSSNKMKSSESKTVHNSSFYCKKQNIFQKIYGVILAPTETFKNLLHEPSILGIFFIVAISQVLVLVLRYDLLSAYAKDQTKLAYQLLTARGDTIPSQDAIQKSIDSSPVNTLYSVSITSVAIWLLMALFIYILVKLFRGSGTYKQFLVITGYSYIPCVLSFIFVGIISIFTDNLYFDIPLTSLAFFYLRVIIHS